jgi:hypothetical protein
VRARFLDDPAVRIRAARRRPLGSWDGWGGTKDSGTAIFPALQFLADHNAAALSCLEISRVGAPRRRRSVPVLPPRMVERLGSLIISERASSWLNLVKYVMQSPMVGANAEVFVSGQYKASQAAINSLMLFPM